MAFIIRGLYGISLSLFLLMCFFGALQMVVLGSGGTGGCFFVAGDCTIGALIITYTILGVTYYKYSIMAPKTLF